MMIVGIIIAIVVIIIIAIVGWYIGTMNGFKKMDIKVTESLSDIDVALTKRYDILTKQLDVTKGYATHEKETLAMTISMRKGMSLTEMSDASKAMDQASQRINMLAESYPNLKADAMFSNLQNSINDVEEHLQASRRLYNSNVSRYNQMIVVFPSSIVANMIHATAKEFFKADEVKRADVEMKF